MFLHALHRNCLILLRQFNCQIKFQNLLLFFGSDTSHPSTMFLLSRSQLQATLYALLTVNFPFGVQAQISASLGKVWLIGMLKIASASWGSKVLRTKFFFQPPSTRFRRDSTISPSITYGLGLITLKECGVGNHLLAQILTLCPFPMFHRDPLSRTSLAAIKLLHVYDGLLPSYASMKLLSRKYIAFRTLCARELGFWLSLLLCCHQTPPCVRRPLT